MHSRPAARLLGTGAEWCVGAEAAVAQAQVIGSRPPLSPRVSPTARDVARLAATYDHGVDQVARGQVIENPEGSGLSREELKILVSAVQSRPSPPFSTAWQAGSRLDRHCCKQTVTTHADCREFPCSRLKVHIAHDGTQNNTRGA
jgi:hypothetical protein